MISPSSEDVSEESDEAESKIAVRRAVVECLWAMESTGRAAGLGASVINLEAAKSGLAGVLVTFCSLLISGKEVSWPSFPAATIGDSRSVASESFLSFSSPKSERETDDIKCWLVPADSALVFAISFPSIFSSLLLSGYGNSVVGGERRGCGDSFVGVATGDAGDSSTPAAVTPRLSAIAFSCARAVLVT